MTEQAHPHGHLHVLAGSWRGEGSARFPTIEAAEYLEELRIEWDDGREVLSYEQLITLSDGRPSHREVGFVRELPEGSLILWNAQDNGRTEVLAGTFTRDAADGALVIELASRSFGNDPRMLGSTRRIRVMAGQLTYEMKMSTTTVPDEAYRPHLNARLRRTT